MLKPAALQVVDDVRIFPVCLHISDTGSLYAAYFLELAPVFSLLVFLNGGLGYIQD